MLDAARGTATRPPRLKLLNGVWLISLPSFAFVTDALATEANAFAEDLDRHSAELRRATVVIDVRGNHGGDSAWGEKFAAVLWGKPWIGRITSSFDNTVDWRASKHNLDFLTYVVQRDRKAGLNSAADYWNRARAAIASALAQHHALAHFEDRPKITTGAAPSNSVKGRIYFLTDHACASACLDFADIIRRLPNVVHIGLSTSADAIYIDNNYLGLPSGIAGLGYSMKVFRNRVRGNNEWYEPQIRWHGGEMTDDSITKWVASLHNSVR
jgi:hypothetical protein